MMKSFLMACVLATLSMSLTINARALAQSASESMHEAGESTESALSHAYHGTKTAAIDTSLTAKVKTALHDDKATHDADIHVTTVASVVTLRGRVASADVSNRAEEIAQHTTGVKAVKNKLKVE